MFQNGTFYFHNHVNHRYRLSLWSEICHADGQGWEAQHLPGAVFARYLLEDIVEAANDSTRDDLSRLWQAARLRPGQLPSDRDTLIDDLSALIAEGAIYVAREKQEIDAAQGGEGASPSEETDDASNSTQQVRTTTAGAAAAATSADAPVDEVEARRARYQERKDLIEETEGDPELVEARERLAFNNDNKLRAEAAAHVYDVDRYSRGYIDELPEPPPGLTTIDPQEITGLENATFISEESGFGSALFKSEINGETMLVFKGTNSRRDETLVEDWTANLSQMRGQETHQYNQAMRLADRAQDSALDPDFSLVGHSLGGGLASAAVAVTGQRGYTFNSAGLHQETATRNGGMSNQEAAVFLETQSVNGDILTVAQKYGGHVLSAAGAGLGGVLGSALTGGAGGYVGGALGALMAPNPPQALGNHRSLPSVNGGHPIDRHNIQQVIDGIGKQKEVDIKTLKEGR